MGKRRQARILALQFMYGYDVNKGELDEVLDAFWKMRSYSPAVEDFARKLIVGTLGHLDLLDQIIRKHLRNWRLGRIAPVDKNIIRLALYELHFRDDIPPLVSINEAVDIAKEFGTSQSGGFVNGILDVVRKELTSKAPGNPEDPESCQSRNGGDQQSSRKGKT